MVPAIVVGKALVVDTLVVGLGGLGGGLGLEQPGWLHASRVELGRDQTHMTWWMVVGHPSIGPAGWAWWSGRGHGPQVSDRPSRTVTHGHIWTPINLGVPHHGMWGAGAEPHQHRLRKELRKRIQNGPLGSDPSSEYQWVPFRAD